MNFYTQQHKHYCGIDLPARAMYVCLLDQHGTKLVHKNLPTTPDAFLRVIAPYREDLVVGVECMFTWYWLADFCSKEGIAFVLGHALDMKAIQGGKAKNDKIEAQKIAVLLRGGMMPQAYVYPAEMRATRDLLRRRCHLARKRAELLAHIHNTNSQYHLPRLGSGSPTKPTGKLWLSIFLIPVSARRSRSTFPSSITMTNCWVRSNSISRAVPKPMMSRVSLGCSQSLGLARFWL